MTIDVRSRPASSLLERRSSPLSHESARVAIQRSHAVAVVVLVLLSVAVRLINLDAPLFTGNTFRQTMTAITVWTYVKEGISFGAYQTPVFGPPWTMPLEFPTYQLTAALLVKLGISNIDLAGRIATLLYFYLSAAILYPLGRRFVGMGAATCALLFYVWSPFIIVWSRNVTFDFTAVAFALAYCYWFARWRDHPQNAGHLVVAIVCGIVATLTKVTTVPTVLVPMGYLVAMDILDRLRDHEYRVTRYIKADARFLAAVAGVFMVPLLPFLVWLHHSDSIKAASEFTVEFTSSGLSKWNYGTWAQKLSPGHWATIAGRVGTMIVTLPGLVFVILGPWLVFKRARRSAAMVGMFVLGAIATVFVFFNLYWMHDYYLIALLPAISLVVGVSAYLVLTTLFEGRLELRRWLPVAVLLIATMLYSNRDYLMWSAKVSYEMPFPALKLGQAIQKHTGEDEYVIVADVFDWDPQYLYYARRKGFMLWHFEGDRSNAFFKQHNFTTVVHTEPHPKLFSNWKYQKLLAVSDRFKIVKVSDTPIP